jgi:hypothetical protein
VDIALIILIAYLIIGAVVGTVLVFVGERGNNDDLYAFLGGLIFWPLVVTVLLGFFFYNIIRKTADKMNETGL